MKSVTMLRLLALAAAVAGHFVASDSFGDPANRCLESRVTVGSSTATAALFDGDSSTGHRIAPGEAEGCNVLFIGAPRWFDRVEVLSDAHGLTVEYLDVESVWRPFGVQPAPIPAATGGPAQWTACESDPVYARGLRIQSPRPGQLYELLATFDGRDPDEVGGSITAAGLQYHADWVNLYPGAGNDLSNCDDDAEGLGNKLPGDWDTWEHGDYCSYEEHFKRTDLGGTNGDHVDNTDLAYFSGHGTSSIDLDSTPVRGLLLGDDTHDDNVAVPGESEGAWDEDLEWMCFMNCRTMEDAGRWQDAMYGTHLLLGFETVSLDVNMGKYFGKYMNDSGAFDSARMIKTSWFDAAEETHGVGYTAMVIGETSTMGNDYLHGEGPVGADPTHDSSYSSWRFNTTASAAATTSTPGMGTHRPHPTSTPSSPVSFSPPEGQGIPVVIDRGILDGPAAVSMPIYNVIPTVVDTGYVRTRAERFCAGFSRLCDGDIGPGDPGEFNLIDGNHELRISRNTGALRYTDVGNWLAWRTSRPEIPVGAEAFDRAQSVRSQLNLSYPDAVFDGVDYLWQGQSESEATLSMDNPDSTFAIASVVRYRRVLPGGRPVVGPGGSMTVALGPNGTPQRIFVGAWRRVIPGAEVNIVPVNDVINHLAIHGSDATVDGIGTFARAIQIDSWELGYYEYTADVDQSTLRPVYILHATIRETPPGVSPPVFSQNRICVWAEALPPDAVVSTPADETPVEPGGTVCFQGTATGGIPPYEYTWRDDTTRRVLGTGANRCATITPMPAGHSSEDAVHSITLTVRDALGHESHDSIRLLVQSTATSVSSPVAEVPRVTRPEFESILPNPTLGSVRMRFSAPVSGAYRVEIYDVSGRRVRSLASDMAVAGSTALDWDGRSENGEAVSPGMYYARVEGAGTSATRRIVVVR